ncbi:protein of unknown function (plasmid) [Magnetospirillum sp. XM-1]|uniref:ATP-grasp domain-containing protein n=1 Tax=Magnetospirillum sp. XM-1 TaxID=1663591 RepID=UPI00073DE19F|nr:ATP-grasp domain-containing protein [Magnetospirillum sp. XM-1]CUW41872.1 protein of unknown function [Magnetospirillum sp. XM-1]
MARLQILWRPIADHLGVPIERMEDAEWERRRHCEAVARHRALFPGVHEDAAQDFEDWHESVARLHAAVATGLPVFLLDRTGGSDPCAITGAVNAAVEDFDPEAPCLHLGTFIRGETLLPIACDDEMRRGFPEGQGTRARREQIAWPVDADARLPDGYPELRAFRDRAGRRVAFCGIPDQEAPKCVVRNDIAAIASEWAREGDVDALIKLVRPAKDYAPMPVRIPQGASREEADHAILLAMEWAYERAAGLPDALLLQDRIPMRDEYRVIVVDGRAVAGAGCIERFAPPSRIGSGPFDPQVEGIRGSGCIRGDPALVARYAAFAEEAAEDIAREAPLWGGYTLDLAQDEEGRVLVVEMNPLMNFGLYAMDAEAVVHALMEAAERRAGIR